MTPAGKRCPRCGRGKPLAAYHRDRTRPDGRAYLCAACRNATRRQPGGRGPYRTLTPARRADRADRVAGLRAAGLSWRQVGAALGVTPEMARWISRTAPARRASGAAA